jgi:hypothetical protein
LVQSSETDNFGGTFLSRITELNAFSIKIFYNSRLQTGTKKPIFYSLENVQLQMKLKYDKCLSLVYDFKSADTLNVLQRGYELRN